MSNETKLSKIRKLLGLEEVSVVEETPQLEVSLEQMQLENGAVLEAEAFEPGYPVFVVAEDEQIPVPVGEYDLADGRKLIVAEEGIIESIGEPSEEPQEEEVVEEEMEAEAAPKKVVESVTKESHFSEEDLEKLSELVFDKLESKLSSYTIDAGEMDTTELEAKLAEVDVEEVKVRKHNPEAEVKELKQEISNKRPSTIRDRVFAKLNQ